jgi:hypothetical protein
LILSVGVLRVGAVKRFNFFGHLPTAIRCHMSYTTANRCQSQEEKIDCPNLTTDGYKTQEDYDDDQDDEQQDDEDEDDERVGGAL